MRLWHKDLISVLPREQLISSWREISAIAGSIQKNGTPNHILVNFVLEYDYDHFISYAAEVRSEMTKRGYRTMDSVWSKITSLKPDWTQLLHDEIYKYKMNPEYFKICYWNLREKFLCKGINSKDWDKIEHMYDVLIRERSLD